MSLAKISISTLLSFALSFAEAKAKALISQPLACILGYLSFRKIPINPVPQPTSKKEYLFEFLSDCGFELANCSNRSLVQSSHSSAQKTPDGCRSLVLQHLLIDLFECFLVEVVSIYEHYLPLKRALRF